MEGRGGILGIWHGILPGTEEAVEEWYNRQHHLERVEIPGFLRARRYQALDEGPRFFCRYDVEAPEVLQSQPYLAVLNSPTEWTRRTMPNYRGMNRTVFRRLARLGQGDGGFVATLRLPGPAPEAEALLARIVADVLPGVVASPLVVSAEAWLRDPGMAPARSEEVRLRGTADATVAAALVVDTTSAAVLPAVIETLRTAMPEAIAGRHQLVFSLAR